MPEFDATIEYRPIEGFPGYKVGNDGTVWTQHQRIGNRWYIGGPWKKLAIHRSKPSGRRVTTYCTVALSRGPERITHSVHTLVLRAFVGDPPTGFEGRHADGNTRNNRLDNLSWGTKIENAADRILHGTHRFGEENGRAKLTEQQVVEIRNRPHESMVSLGREYGVSDYCIRCIRIKKLWKHI